MIHHERLPDTPSSRFELRHAASDRPMLVTVGERVLYAIDGLGPPAGSDYHLAGDVLRRIASTLIGRLGRSQRPGSRLPVLETLWWTEPSTDWTRLPETFDDRSDWHWRQLIEIPDEASQLAIDDAIATVQQEARRAQPLVRVVRFREGRAAQVLHVGGAATARASLRLLVDAIQALGLVAVGPVHELHLAHERDVPAGSARAIIRLPVGDDSSRARR
ncbi:MAG: hypothetical protein FIA92_01935 [Chloroflexi bacterium]|nr:hypothetical protein [Chloroflexota bacterium]